MKKTIQLLALSLMVFGFVACKRCIECTTTTKQVVSGIEQSASVTDEKCGNEEERDAFEEEKMKANVTQNVNGVQQEITTTCHKK